MAQCAGIIPLPPEDRARSVAVIGDRNCPQKHVQRARIVLLSANRLPVLEVARQVGISRPAVWRWQVCYTEQGVNGLLRDKTRKPGKAPIPLETVAKVLALPCTEPPGNATHWTGHAVAKAVGIREHNGQVKPFVWTKSAEAILNKLDHLPVPSE